MGGGIGRTTAWIGAACLLAALALPVGAQQPVPLPPASPASGAATTGSAGIAGVVVSAVDPSKPVRHAIVRLSRGGELSRGAVTDDEGRFAIELIPGGRYTLTASKPAYVTTEFGAAGPGGAGTTIVVRDGEHVSDLAIPLTPGAVITGTVHDPSGEPAQGMQVFVVGADAALTTAQGADVRAGAAMDAVVTDDLGSYRFFGLAAGSYMVGAVPRPVGGTDRSPGLVVLEPARVDGELLALRQIDGRKIMAPVTEGPRVATAPVFYPSTTLAEQAAAVTVAPGEERGGVDIKLVLVPIATIEGMIVSTGVQGGSGVSLRIDRPGPPLPLNAGFGPSLVGPGPDGSFRYTGVAPGTYTISARSSPNEAPTSFLWATATITVSGSDVSGVALPLRRALTMSGRVLLDTPAPQASAALSRVRLSLTPVRNRSLVGPASVLLAARPVTGTARADGSFELGGLTPGTYVLGADAPGGLSSTEWWLRSAMLDGQDLLDRPIEITDADLPDVVVTLSDRHTEISGTLSSANGRSVLELSVVAVPEDRALWSSARRVRQVRPASDGRFAFTDLPPGTYRLAVLSSDPPGDWRSADFLSTLTSASVAVTLEEGEKKTQDLRIGGGLVALPCRH